MAGKRIRRFWDEAEKIQVLALALILPGKTVFAPDVGPSLRRRRFGRAPFEHEPFARRVDRHGVCQPEQAADIYEVRLGRRALLQLPPAPFIDEFLRCHSGPHQSGNLEVCCAQVKIPLRPAPLARGLFDGDAVGGPFGPARLRSWRAPVRRPPRCGGSPAGRRTDASHWQGQGGRPCDPVWQGRGEASSVGEPCQRMSGREVTPGVCSVGGCPRAAGGDGPSLLPGRGAYARGAGESRVKPVHRPT